MASGIGERHAVHQSATATCELRTGTSRQRRVMSRSFPKWGACLWFCLAGRSLREISGFGRRNPLPAEDESRHPADDYECKEGRHRPIAGNAPSPHPRDVYSRNSCGERQAEGGPEPPADAETRSSQAQRQRHAERRAEQPWWCHGQSERLILRRRQRVENPGPRSGVKSRHHETPNQRCNEQHAKTPRIQRPVSRDPFDASSLLLIPNCYRLAPYLRLRCCQSGIVNLESTMGWMSRSFPK